MEKSPLADGGTSKGFDCLNFKRRMPAARFHRAGNLEKRGGRNFIDKKNFSAGNFSFYQRELARVLLFPLATIRSFFFYGILILKHYRFKHLLIFCFSVKSSLFSRSIDRNEFLGNFVQKKFSFESLHFN